MWDYEHPYAGGPMVKVDGFPRPLYPPDARPPYEPSRDGVDTLAYKRVVCRLGRWGPWDPASWDDSYSSAFSHGKPGTGGDVQWTGVAGCQRQQRTIEPTGYIGTATFNFLRSARIPEGRDNAGDMAMDAYAADLINQAFAQFGGHEPSSGGDVRIAALERAKSQIGVKESPSGSNHNPYGQWYGMDYQPWCAIFTTWCYELGAKDVGKDSPTFVKGSRYAYVPTVVSDAYAGRNGLSVTYSPKPGDLVAYDWDWSVPDHIGIFEKWINGTQWYAIEGNTSTSNNSNGGEVMRRTRTQGAQGTTFMVVREP